MRAPVVLRAVVADFNTLAHEAGEGGTHRTSGGLERAARDTRRSDAAAGACTRAREDEEAVPEARRRPSTAVEDALADAGYAMDGGRRQTSDEAPVVLARATSSKCALRSRPPSTEGALRRKAVCVAMRVGLDSW